ncbi:hypothetical protein DAI22_04g092400 [Oryza sativa Japonica Group]|nr:hypothetical protein DAI22_04g092400 [Oryza sativa Japonica Group]
MTEQRKRYCFRIILADNVGYIRPFGMKGLWQINSDVLHMRSYTDLNEQLED